MKADDPRHGTSPGYQQHRRDGEPACDPCRDAQATKMREHRKGPVAHTARAQWRLIDAHRDEYERYYAEELAAQRVVGSPRRAS